MHRVTMTQPLRTIPAQGGSPATRTPLSMFYMTVGIVYTSKLPASASLSLYGRVTGSAAAVPPHAAEWHSAHSSHSRSALYSVGQDDS